MGDGFAVTEEELGRAVLEHAVHGRVDSHPAWFDAEGNGMQVQIPHRPPRPWSIPATVL